jgi:hypothetical protein
VILLLGIAIVIVLALRPGRAMAIRQHRMSHLVPVLDGVRAVALVAIPLLAALSLDSVASTSSPSRRTRPPAPEAPATPPAAQAATTRTACRNSFDPACGPFRWDPPPGPNSPLEISITHSPSAARIGGEVTVTVHVSDADALIDDVMVSFGDGDVFTIPPASIISCDVEPPTGPWDPPEPSPDAFDKTFPHTYTKAGDFTISAYAASPEILDPTCPPHPYASQATASSPIHVGAS